MTVGQFVVSIRQESPPETSLPDKIYFIMYFPQHDIYET